VKYDNRDETTVKFDGSVLDGLDLVRQYAGFQRIITGDLLTLIVSPVGPVDSENG